MKKNSEEGKLEIKYFSMKTTPSFNDDLERASREEQRDKTAIVRDAVRFYLNQSEGQKRFEILSNQLAMSTQQRINASILEMEAWVGESRKTISWMSEAKTAIEKSTYSLGREVLQLRDENRQLKQMLEQMMTMMGTMTNGSGGGYQPRMNANSNLSTSPKPPFSNLVHQSAPD